MPHHACSSLLLLATTSNLQTPTPKAKAPATRKPCYAPGALPGREGVSPFHPAATPNTCADSPIRISLHFWSSFPQTQGTNIVNTSAPTVRTHHSLHLRVRTEPQALTPTSQPEPNRQLKPATAPTRTSPRPQLVCKRRRVLARWIILVACIGISELVYFPPGLAQASRLIDRLVT